MVVIEILKTRTCPWCPIATSVVRKVASETGAEVVETYLETEEGRKKAERLGVVSVPTILLDGEVFSVGVPEEEELKRAVEERKNER